MAYDFDKIARTYDRLNRVMTLGLDCRWRKHAVRGLKGEVLDVACGTGDMMVELTKRGAVATGVDISEEMLTIAKRKLPQSTFLFANAENLPFEDATFDAVTCAFGVRNFVNLEKGLGEMMRVLKPSGCLVVLELATPDNALIKPFYKLYTKFIIPLFGEKIAGNREAYTYLPESMESFPKGDAMVEILRSVGAGDAFHHKFSFGVCRMYTVKRG